MIIKAAESDLNQIMQIIERIIEETKEIKNYQWDNIYPTKDIFENDIKNGNLYIYKNNLGEIMGFVCIDSNRPTEYSNLDWRYKGKFLVIHRMAVNTNSRGLGIGKNLMEYAEKLAKSNDINIIRSDTYSTNKTMNFMFEKFGYKFSGNINLMGKSLKFNCYEKCLNL